MTGRIITIAQQKGGSGKTTLAANLAVAFIKAGRRVGIVDTDPQGSVGRWVMARREALGDDEAGIGFRTASAWGAKMEARELLKTHDIVLIDTPPKLGYDAKPAIEAADLVLVPAMPSQIDLWATEPTLVLARDVKKPVLIVLNRASQRAKITGEIAGELAGMGEVARTTLASRVAYAETMGEGRGVVERAGNGPAAHEMQALASEILQRMG